MSSVKTDKPANILFVGVGGQGIVLASDILALAAMYSGYDVKKSEIHGMSQRGGSVFAHVRFGKKVYSPMVAAGEADVIVSLEEMEALRWLGYSNDSTKIILVKARIIPANAGAYPEGTEGFLRHEFRDVTALDPSELAEKLGGPKFINVAALGALSKYIDVKPADVERAIRECVPRGSAENNIEAFDFGRQI